MHFRQVLTPKGARINATTSRDRTNFFETLPLQHLELAMKVEADRMESAYIRAEDKQSEMTVVRNEYEIGENNEFEALYNKMWALAFETGGYHHPTIGYKDDIENVPIEVLQNFYKKFYNPENAALIVTGKFNLQPVLEMIQRNFGKLTRNKCAAEPSCESTLKNATEKSITAAKAMPTTNNKVYTFESDQQGQKSFVLKKAGITTPILVLGFKKPPSNVPASIYIEMIGRILSDGRKSRFNKLFVEKEKIFTSAECQNENLIDSGLISFFFTFNTDVVKIVDTKTADATLKKIIFEIENLKSTLSDNEFEVIKTTMSNQLKIENITSSMNMADFINENETVTGDWKSYLETKKIIDETTKDDLINVLSIYYSLDYSIFGLLLPVDEKIQDKSTNAYVKKSDEKFLKKIGNEQQQSPQTSAKDVLKLVDPTEILNIADNIVVSIVPLTFKTKMYTDSTKTVSKPIAKQLEYYQYISETGKKINLVFMFPIGPYTVKSIQPEKNIDKLSVITTFVSMMVSRGTDTLSASQIEDMLNENDAGVNISFDDYYCIMSVEAEGDKLLQILKLAFEMLFRSTYEEKDFEEIKTQLKQYVLKEDNDPSSRASKKLKQILYPKNHRNSALETPELLKIIAELTLVDIKEYVARHMKLTNAFKLVKVGAKTPFKLDYFIDQALRHLENQYIEIVFQKTEQKQQVPYFFIDRDNTAGNVQSAIVFENLKQNGNEKLVKSKTENKIEINIPEKTSTTVLFGQRIDLLDSDLEKTYLEIAIYILGGGGFTSRLMESIRVQRGLTYGIYADLSSDDYNTKGHLVVKSTFAPENVETGIIETQKVINNWIENGVSESELTDTKNYFTANYQVSLEKSTTVLAIVSNELRENKNLNYAAEHIKRINESTLDQVNTAIKKYVDPKAFVIIKSGTL